MGAFTDIFIRRPILSIVVSLLILLGGGGALFLLPLREFPNLESATIEVNTSYPGATQEVMQGFVTTPIAQAIATANGIEYLSSTSTQGNSSVKAKLVLNANADRSMTEILAKIQQVKYQLPPGATDPVISKITDGASPVAYISFVAPDLTPPRIADFATRVAQPLFTSVPGVASADFFGNQRLAMRIWVDPSRLAARGISGAELAAALRANNVQAAPGQLKSASTVMNITAATDLSSIEDFRRMVIKSGGSDGVVRLGDVATVEIGGANYGTSFITNGRTSVTIAVTPTPDGNPLEIVKAVNKLIPGMQRVAPPGMKIFNQFDVAHFVNASINEVTKSLGEAIVIVIVVIFLFLGSFRAVAIPVITIPLSLVGAAGLMLLMGFSLNLLTLLAMVLAIGLVVDDAIVVVENIHRHIEEGLSPVHAAIVGAREIVRPVIAMTITLAAVYAPIGVMGGLTGALFKEFAFTLASAVVVSGVVALTLSPMMSSWLLKPSGSEGRMAQMVEHAMERTTSAYGRLLARTLDARPLVLVFAVAILAAIALLFSGAKRELAPQEDQGYFFAQVKAPQYANLAYTERASTQVEHILHTLPEAKSTFFARGTDGENNAFGGVVLQDWNQRHRSADQLQALVNQKVGRVANAFATAFQAPPLPAGSGGLPVQMVVRSPDDFPALYAAMEQIKGAAWGSRLFAFVDSDLAFDSPEARITIDRSKAGEMGVSMQAIADTLAILLGENYVNRFNWHNRAYDVITQVPREQRLSPENIGQFYVKAGSGQLVPLSTVVQVDTRPQANRLPQFNQMNAVTLSGVLAPGVTMGEAVDFLQNQPLPPGATVDWMGDSRQYVKEGNQLTVSFALALVVIFLVLMAQFESWRDPIVILVTVPLAVCGALAPIYLGFTTLNIYTQIGLVTLIGLISKHGILMVSFANDIQKHEDLDRAGAIAKAAAVRLRPVLMTTAAMVAGLFPLLFAHGAGAASRFAIGIVVVTGMLVGTLFTLFVLPTFYTLLARDHRASALGARERELAALEA